MKRKTKTTYFCDCGRMVFNDKTMTWEDSMVDNAGKPEGENATNRTCPSCNEKLLESPTSNDSGEFVVFGFPDIPGQITYVSPDNT
jgi:hypothetical protein